MVWHGTPRPSNRDTAERRPTGGKVDSASPSAFKFQGCAKLGIRPWRPRAVRSGCASCRDGEMPCTIDASVVQSETNGAPPIRAALVQLLQAGICFSGHLGCISFQGRSSLPSGQTHDSDYHRKKRAYRNDCLGVHSVSDQIEAARATKHRDHCTAHGAQAASRCALRSGSGSR